MNAQTHALTMNHATRPTASWWLSREAALNWLALGLLLGAWNAVDDGKSRDRPESLRAYGSVSVRAVHRVHAEP